MKLFRLIAVLGVGCATFTRCATPGGAVSSRPDLTISIGEENVRVGQSNFPIGDAEAMRAGLAGACESGCDHVEIRAIPMARYDALLASYAAGVQSNAGGLQLRIATSAPVLLMTGAAGSPSAECPAEVVMRHQQIDVYVNGEILPPADACEQWGATVCDTGTQDPMKRAEIEALGKVVEAYRPRFLEHTCLYLESEMPAMLVDHVIQTVHSRAGKGVRFSLRRDRRPGRLQNDAVTEAIVAQGAALTACYDVELEKTRAPMEAVVRILIGPDGKVARVALRDTVQTTPSFEECLTSAVKALSFPRPDNGGTVEINYPLRFSPRPGLGG